MPKAIVVIMALATIVEAQGRWMSSAMPVQVQARDLMVRNAHTAAAWGKNQSPA